MERDDYFKVCKTTKKQLSNKCVPFCYSEILPIHCWDCQLGILWQEISFQTLTCSKRISKKEQNTFQFNTHHLTQTCVFFLDKYFWVNIMNHDIHHFPRGPNHKQRPRRVEVPRIWVIRFIWRSSSCLLGTSWPWNLLNICKYIYAYVWLYRCIKLRPRLFSMKQITIQNAIRF